jgi:2-polyprenyl-6-methoxyphenol hydroxylase-like FAD-dependent oxidoreductase
VSGGDSHIIPGILTFHRSGYDLAFLDRQQLLKTLYEHLEDKHKVLLNKKVVAVDHSSSGIKVTCADGSSYAGHVLAGADGVSSRTRAEMWRLASPNLPEVVGKDEKGTCIFQAEEHLRCCI